nr:conjugal transfer protein TraD [Pseudomonas aeruginosa]
MNQRKYSVGGLAQIAGLLEADPGFVLGLMLEAAEQRDRDGTWPSAVFEKYKRRGDEVLAERAAARKRRKLTDDDDDDESDFDAAATPIQNSRYQEGAH